MNASIVSPKLFSYNLKGSVKIPSQETLDVGEAVSNNSNPGLEQSTFRSNIFLEFKAKAFNSEETFRRRSLSPTNGSVIVLNLRLPGILITRYTL
jgi:hypothetical protein